MGNCSPAWRFHRKIFTTALRQYLSNTPLTESRVNTQAKKMVNFMRQQDGKPFDPADCLMRTVADVICGIIFKEGCDTMNQDLERLLKLNANFIANAGDIQEATILDFFPWGRYLPVKSYDRIFKVFDEIHSIIRKFVRERKDTFDPSEKVGDFLACLLSAQHDLQCESYEEEKALLSEDHCVVAIEDMFLAGYETTSTTLRFVISFLVRFPDYQKDIQSQLDEVIGSRKPSLDDRPNLPLIQATILEALRVGNVLPLAVSHVALTDTTLCGYRVPRDTIVFANTESVHLDPSCWDDPDVFNPYRHIDADGKLITNQGNFYPFGAGRRVCAGESLAKVELFLFVSWLLQSFTFIQVEENLPKLKGAFVQFPDRYKIRAIKRTLPTGN